jgi:cardiolipin synthase
MSTWLTFWGTWVHVSMSILGLLLYVATTHTLQQRRHPAAALSWILSFFFMPYLALPAYVAFGQRKIKAGTIASPPPAGGEGTGRRHWMSAMLESMGAAPARAEGELRLHMDGDESLAALWSCIDEARVRIFVGTYLIGDDRIGGQVIERLARRAAEGIEVRLLLDGVGCLMVREHRLRPLLRAGGHSARAFPPLRRLLRRQSNFRNHRKQVICDGERLWMGGRNFADEYFDRRDAAADAPPGWYDLSLDVRGEVAADAEAIFLADWLLATGERLAPSPRRATHAAANEMQLLGSGPDQPQDSLAALLVTACFRAQSRILVVTPYLIPDPALLQAMNLAARRAVRVDVVLPRRSNHRLADHARSRALRELARSGVNVWLSPAMVHAKAVVFDDIALCGSANLDARSLYLNFELTLVLYEAQSARTLAGWIEQRRAEAEPFVPQPASIARDIFEGAVLWLGFQL